MGSNDKALAALKHALSSGNRAGAVSAFRNLDAGAQKGFLSQVMAKALGKK